MKLARTFILILAIIGSFALPIFFLAVRHFHLEGETAEWIVSMWPQSDVALEDKRAAADMLVTYGELAPAGMLIYTAIGWCGVLVYSRFFKRGGKAKESLDTSL